MKTPTSHPSMFPTSSLSVILLVVLCVNQGQGQGQGGAMSNNKMIINVGVILDMDNPVGKKANSCISMALTDYYSAHNHTKTRLHLHTRNSGGGTVDAASAAIDLIKNVQVQAILGPQLSSQAVFVVNIGNKTQVPIISYSATSPSLSFSETPYFIRTTLNDSAQVKGIAAIVEAFGWREVVPIYEDTAYGNDMIPYLTDALQDVNARVPYRSVVPLFSTDEQIHDKLLELVTKQSRVFVVHMTLSLGSRLFPIAEEIGMMKEGYVWIITDGLTELFPSMNASSVPSMNGVLGIKPYIPKSEKRESFRSRWKRKYIHDNPEEIDEAEMSVFGLWAYDTVWALATAVDKVNAVTPPPPRFNKLDKGNNSTDLETLGISQIGPNLRIALLQTKFNGLSGEFWLKDGQLQSSAFEIVNVVGKAERNIGFWSPVHEISREWNGAGTGTKTKTVAKDNLGAIIWPGEPKQVPKGWEVPEREKKLRIGVPVNDGFSEFVKVQHNFDTNATEVTGFCIDVFEAVIKLLHYAVPYEFIPFAKDDGKSAGDYNELVDQITYQIYDGVVGDLTILSNRSQHVDFTLPFSENGVSMVVRIKDDDRKNAWIFLKPLTRGLWLTTGGFFIFTGFVVWVLEHRINKDFRGRPSQQIGMIFWFSFSTLVFAHKERVISNLARFVVIIWVFVVLILTSSYTANLTSMLTVQQLQPSATDIKDLQKKGDFVGFQKGSYVSGLVKSLGFHPTKIKQYSTIEEYHDALSKGSQNNGVTAIFDEISYIRLLLAKYCKKYMMVRPTYKTAGFGFAFPKGSPLVADISRAILNVTEGEMMAKIEKTWFGNNAFCSEQEGGTVTSDSLTLDSFKGLFLIAGVSSAAAVIIHLFIFFYEHRNILASEDSVSQKIATVALQFDREKHVSSLGSNKIHPSTLRKTGIESGATEYDTSSPQSPVTSVSLHHEQVDFSHETIIPNIERTTSIEDPSAVIGVTLKR